MHTRLINRTLAVFSITLALTTVSCSSSDNETNSRTISFDQNWHFLKGDPPGAESPSFDDSGWRLLDVPHDWSIEDLPGQNGESVTGPFSKTSIGKMGTGYTVGGTAWYRKEFTIDPSGKGKTAYLQFDGVYMNSDVWINGRHVGTHPYGYTSFWYDITPYLNPAGESNVVAVQVKNEGINARWYSGSGIYRHTWLTQVDPLHIAPWGVFVSTPEVSSNHARINIATTVKNSGDIEQTFTCLVRILNPEGAEVGRSTGESVLRGGESTDLNQTIHLEDPSLWSIDHPSLYQAKVEILVNEQVRDGTVTPFGIRHLHFNPETGFTLNGEDILLKGGCFHHDNGPLGAAAIDRAEERKIELLKEAGFNAIRCSHNPPSPYLLDVCDRLGMLVIDEAFDMWESSKMEMMNTLLPGMEEQVTAMDYSKFFKESWRKDLRSMLLRDRNHPSVIMWSIGNEIPEAADSSGLRIARELVSEVKNLDILRPVTEAHVDIGAQMGMSDSWEQRAPHLALMDVIGYNYAYHMFELDHQKHPERIMYASEFFPPRSLENWQKVEALPYVIGNFSWTAMDHLGEAGIGVPRLIDDTHADPSNPFADIGQFFNPNSWPMVDNFAGDLDLIGNPKAAYYYQHVVWREFPLSILVHRPIPAGKKELNSPWGFPDELKSWNWEGHEGEPIQVNVYTRCEKVKLELNGKTIGEQTVDDSKSITANFEVPYEPGTLTATCYENGNVTSSETLRTTGKPAAIRLVADRSSIGADRNDLSYIMVEIVDEEGNLVPDADDIWINFGISGAGEIAGVGNGYHSDVTSFQQPKKKTWQGRCLAIVRPLGDQSGKVTLTADAEGLEGASV
ncbi:MAG: glycoside hydrolase family 2 TIM barrel-domain containing protein, partial [Bacteroidales bacterium]